MNIYDELRKIGLTHNQCDDVIELIEKLKSDNSEDYQNEFWDWMHKKGYGEKTCTGNWVYEGCDCGAHFHPTTQMLTGYIIEFMQDRG